MRKLTAVTMLALALAACEARLEMKVRDNGSGQMGFTFLAEKQALDAMKQFGGDPFDEMRKDLANDPVPWKVANVSENGQSGIRATFEFADVADLKEKLDALNAEDGDDPFVDGQLILERAAGGWRFEAKANAPTTSNLMPPAPPGQTPPGFEQSGLGSLFGGLRFVFRISLPGAPGNTNAKRVTRTADGSQFEWTFNTTNPESGQQLVAATTAAAAGGGFPALPVAAAVVLLGGVGTALVLRRPKAPPAPVMEGFPVPAPVAQELPAPVAGKHPPAVAEQRHEDFSRGAVL